MRISLFCSIILSAVIIVAACKKNSTTKSYTPSCSGSAPSFTSSVLPLMQSSCNNGPGCHGSGSNNGPGALTSYSLVKSSASRVRSSVVSGSMPQGTTLSDDQRNVIVCWIDAGMPDN